MRRRKKTVQKAFAVGLTVVLFGAAMVSAAAGEIAYRSPEQQVRYRPGGWDMGADPGSWGEDMLEFVRSFEPPEFREGHRLLPLTRYTDMPIAVQKEMAENWGYALRLGLAASASETMKALEDPNSPERTLLALAASDPERYPLQLNISPSRAVRTLEGAMCPIEYLKETQRPLYGSTDYLDRIEDVSEKGGYWGLAELMPEAFFQHADGEFVLYARRGEPGPTLSSLPEANEYISIRAEVMARMFKAISEHAEVDIVTNGAEYDYCRRTPRSVSLADPRVREAWEEDGREWIEFRSDRKSDQEELYKSIVMAETPPGTPYFVYSEISDGVPQRHSRPDWINTDFLYRGLSTYPCPRHYTNSYAGTGFTGTSDILTQALNCKAQELDYGGEGSHLIYPFLSQGWRESRMADAELFQGFVKCLYTAGAVGSINYGGLKAYGRDGKARSDYEQTIPQMLIASHVHALFSHLDEFLFEGELLPGPDRHRWSRDLPAYEFPTGYEHKRVLARRLRGEDRWLVTAWAADGMEAEVEVEIPDLGTITVDALPGGNVMVFGKGNSAVELPVLGVDPDASVEELGRILETGTVMQRQKALHRLGRLGGEESMNLVSEALDDRDASVGRAALRALLRIDTSKALTHFKDDLNSDDVDVRRRAVRTLSGYSDRAPVAGRLSELRDDPDHKVREMVASALWPFELEATGHEEAGTEFARRPPHRVVKLDPEDWLFRLDPSRRGHLEQEQWYKPVDETNDWQHADIGQHWHVTGRWSDDADRGRYIGVAWYQTEFTFPDDVDYERAVLHFGAVDESAWVWVNGEYAGGHDIGPSGWDKPFYLDISDHVREDRPNNLAVRVMNTIAGGGIWKPVSLELY